MFGAQPVIIQSDEPTSEDGPPDSPGEPQPQGRLPDDYSVVQLGINGEEQDPERRDKMAVAEAPYLHSKMTAVQHSGSAFG